MQHYIIAYHTTAHHSMFYHTTATGAAGPDLTNREALKPPVDSRVKWKGR